MKRQLSWDELEELVRRRMDNIDGPAHTTIGSGNKFGDQDVRSAHFLFQCKSTGNKSVVIDHRDWDELQGASLKERGTDGNYRTGVFITSNSSGDVMATIDIEDFVALVERAYGGNKKGI